MNLTTRAAAALVKRPVVTVRSWAQRGYIKAEKLGRDWLIDEKSLLAFKPRKAGRPIANRAPTR